MKLSLLFATGLALGSVTAFAQPESAPPPADAPAAAAPAPAANYSPAEIDTFAAVTVKLQAINADSTLDPQKKQEAMRSAASEAGLDAAKYNEIARAAEADASLKDKILAAVAAKRGSGGAAPSPSR